MISLIGAFVTAFLSFNDKKKRIMKQNVLRRKFQSVLSLIVKTSQETWFYIISSCEFEVLAPPVGGLILSKIILQINCDRLLK